MYIYLHIKLCVKGSGGDRYDRGPDGKDDPKGHRGPMVLRTVKGREDLDTAKHQ